MPYTEQPLPQQYQGQPPQQQLTAYPLQPHFSQPHGQPPPAYQQQPNFSVPQPLAGYSLQQQMQPSLMHAFLGPQPGHLQQQSEAQWGGEAPLADRAAAISAEPCGKFRPSVFGQLGLYGPQ